MSTYLVVLDGARAEDEVLTTLLSLKEEDATATFTLLVPADRRRFATEGECWLEAAQRANEVLEVLKGLGLDVAEAVVGDFMRRKAIGEELRRGERVYDGIILFTIPFLSGMHVSRIVPGDIASQLQRRHRLPVRHITVGARNPSPGSALAQRLRQLNYVSISRRN